MTEAEFHAKRIMWAVVDGTVLVRPAGDTRGHREWLSGLFGADTVAALWPTMVRGFVWKTESREDMIWAYVGDDFDVPRGPVQRQAVIEASHLFAGVIMFYLGAVRQPAGVQPWPPREAVGWGGYVHRGEGPQ